MTELSLPNTRLYGHKLTLARILWGFVFILSIGLYAASIPLYTSSQATICTTTPCNEGYISIAEAEALHQVGLSLDFHNWYYFILDNFVVYLPWVLMAVLIFWRKSDDWMGILTSIFLIAFPASILVSDRLGSLHPFLNVFYLILGSMGQFMFVFLFLLFPDGRFVPRWLRWLAIPSLLLVFIAVLWKLENKTVLPGSQVFFLLVLIAIGAQVYRYRRVSGPIQKQQIKWVVVSIVALPLTDLVFRALILGAIFSAYQQPGLGRVIYNMITIPLFRDIPFMLVPISFAFSILRYRLWDIDIIIRRTLLYGVLTGTLIALYLGIVLLLQELFQLVTGQHESQVATVISTLAIIAMFTPLRQRIQNSIDRRFYRRRYDAEQTLAHFSASMRELVDLDELIANLVKVVEETMQPEQVSLWLRKPPSK